MYDKEDIIAAAKALVPYLKDPLQTQVKSLLGKAEQGEAVHNLLLDVLSKDETSRSWLRSVLAEELMVFRDMEMSEKYGTEKSIYDEPAGDPHVPSTVILVCPLPSCEFRVVLRHVGQHPTCIVHKVQLVPEEQKRKE